MKKLTEGLLIFLFFAVPLTARPYLYVSHNKYKKISIIDTAVNKVVKEVALKVSVKDIKLDPKNKYLYFLSFDYNALYRMKTKNFAPDRNYVSVGYGPVSLAISPDGKRAYVANYRSKNISIVELPGMEVSLDPVPLPGAPRVIAVSDDNKKAYIAMNGRAGVAVMSLEKNKITKVIKTGADPWGMCVKGSRAYITNEGMSSISVIDTRRDVLKNEVVTSDTPRGIASLRDLLYVAVMNGIDVFEVRRYEKPASMGVDYEVYDVVSGKTPSGHKIFVAGYDKTEKMGKVVVIDPIENDVAAEINVPGWPVYLEMRKKWPTPEPTYTYTPLPTGTYTPTDTFTDTATDTPTDTPTYTSTATPVPTKVKKKRRHKTKKRGLLTSTFKGRIFMSSRPLRKVRIKAISKSTDKIYKTYTDGNGRFIFKKLPIGGYTISVEATYIKEKSVSVVVNRGRNKEIIINVKKRR